LATGGGVPIYGGAAFAGGGLAFGHTVGVPVNSAATVAAAALGEAALEVVNPAETIGEAALEVAPAEALL
jgi:hypothetical protein